MSRPQPRTDPTPTRSARTPRGRRLLGLALLAGLAACGPPHGEAPAEWDRARLLERATSPDGHGFTDLTGQRALADGELEVLLWRAAGGADDRDVCVVAVAGDDDEGARRWFLAELVRRDEWRVAYGPDHAWGTHVVSFDRPPTGAEVMDFLSQLPGAKSWLQDSDDPPHLDARAWVRVTGEPRPARLPEPREPHAYERGSEPL